MVEQDPPAFFYESMLSCINKQCQIYQEGLTTVEYNTKVYDEKSYDENNNCFDEYKHYYISCHNLYDSYNNLDKKEIYDESGITIHKFKRVPQLLAFDTIHDTNSLFKEVDITYFEKRDEIQYPEYIELYDKKNVSHQYKLIGFVEQCEFIDDHVISNIKTFTHMNCIVVS